MSHQEFVDDRGFEAEQFAKEAKQQRQRKVVTLTMGNDDKQDRLVKNSQ